MVFFFFFSVLHALINLHLFMWISHEPAICNVIFCFDLFLSIILWHALKKGAYLPFFLIYYICIVFTSVKLAVHWRTEGFLLYKLESCHPWNVQFLFWLILKLLTTILTGRYVILTCFRFWNFWIGMYSYL